MKKLTALLLTLVVGMSFAGCGNKNVAPAENGKTDNKTESKKYVIATDK